MDKIYFSGQDLKAATSHLDILIKISFRLKIVKKKKLRRLVQQPGKSDC